MAVIFWATTLPILATALVILRPIAFRSLVAELKRRWRLHLIRRYGKMTYQDLSTRFRALASMQGYDKQMVEEILRDAKTYAIHRLGKKQTNAHLGKPTPLERYH